jgi:cyclic pyranopterin phosphate synthase
VVNAPLASVVSDALIDQHGRRLRKLRVSLTEACNLRCVYCMPEHATFAGRDELLSPTEIVDIVSDLANIGIEAVRITGGEPTLRAEFAEIARRICEIPGLRVGLTTNGSHLARHARSLAEWGLHGVNVSLDSLDPDNFRRMARAGDLVSVLSGIRAARDAGLLVKINTVVMRGWNDHELEAFHDFAIVEGVEVRFLELMRIGEALPFFDQRFVAASEMLARLELHSPLIPVQVEDDATAFKRISQAGASLGFIASESVPFCGGCSRLRLSAKGTLRACLFKEEGVSLRGLDRQELPDILRQVARLKPIGRIASISQAMHTIGG